MEEAIIKLSEGNPGAISALFKVLELPDIFLKSLADQGISGSNIWVFFSDLCDKDVIKFLDGILSGRLKERLIMTEEYKWTQRQKGDI